ncbi:hypothetical protein NIES2101_40785 [Calothrix sp. HK-06]|nr:hypothetical protein NIES2101_40785 [Calothrix sp. HK-06]
MKLKPSLLKLIVTLMTISFLASCASTPETSQECNRAQAVQGQPNQKVNNCPPNSSSGSRSYYGGSSGSRFGGSSRVGSGASDGGSHSTVGRSGFGSFGRGGHGGG